MFRHVEGLGFEGYHWRIWGVRVYIKFGNAERFEDSWFTVLGCCRFRKFRVLFGVCCFFCFGFGAWGLGFMFTLTPNSLPLQGLL